MHRPLVVCLTAVALVSIPRFVAAQSVRFVRDWETSVDVYNQKSGTGVCVDKLRNLHIITTDGLWATLDPSGKVIRKTEDDVLQGAFACLSSENQVVVAVPQSSARMTRRFGCSLRTKVTCSKT
jgi:hypothetical protein